MNILILISSLSYGGAQKQAVIDANLLSEDNKVFLGTFKNGPLSNQLSEKVEFVFFKKGNYFLTIKKVASFVKNEQIDIIHASLFAPMIISALASIMTKVGVVWHFHSHEYDIPFRSVISLKILSRFLSIKKILFVNHELMEYFIKRFKFPLYKLDVLYNSSDYSDVQEFLPQKSKKFTIGYIGRFVELKRVNYLIELGEFLNKQRVKNWEIDLVGDGPDREKLERVVKKKKLNDHIKFYGFQADTFRYYRSFDLFINPSREECLSIALIDSGISSVPSIAFDTGGNNEIIQNSISGFIVKTKEEMFKKTLLLINNLELREKFGNQARKHCMEMFSPQKHLIELEEIYKQCIFQK